MHYGPGCPDGMLRYELLPGRRARRHRCPLLSRSIRKLDRGEPTVITGGRKARLAQRQGTRTGSDTTQSVAAMLRWPPVHVALRGDERVARNRGLLAAAYASGPHAGAHGNGASLASSCGLERQQRPAVNDHRPVRLRDSAPCSVRPEFEPRPVGPRKELENQDASLRGATAAPRSVSAPTLIPNQWKFQGQDTVRPWPRHRRSTNRASDAGSDACVRQNRR